MRFEATQPVRRSRASQVRRSTPGESSVESLRRREGPHVATALVWDVPSFVPAGSRFSVSVGAKCPNGCSLAGAPLEVVDETGTRLVAARLGRKPFAGTSGLYWAAAQVVTPARAGLSTWSVVMSICDHTCLAAPLAFTVAELPHCVLTVAVVDGRGAPVFDAVVMAGRFRASTDSAGVAQVPASLGRCEILVLKAGLAAPATTITVNRDASLCIALVATAEPTDDFWL